MFSKHLELEDQPGTVIDDRAPVIDQISGDLPLC